MVLPVPEPFRRQVALGEHDGQYRLDGRPGQQGVRRVLREVTEGAYLLNAQIAHDGRQDEAFNTLLSDMLLHLLEVVQVVGVN
jgi:hypothetical protein